MSLQNRRQNPQDGTPAAAAAFEATTLPANGPNGFSSPTNTKPTSLLQGMDPAGREGGTGGGSPSAPAFGRQVPAVPDLPPPWDTQHLPRVAFTGFPGDLCLTFYAEAVTQEYETTGFTHFRGSPTAHRAVTSTRGRAGREQSIPPGTAAHRLWDAAGCRARGAPGVMLCQGSAPPASRPPLASLGPNVASLYLVIPSRFPFQPHREPRNT